ncbi:hypothetical protein LTS14_002288 [Recurvomyces mirabilis]|uniref:uncharacterized protein n=1 Tax=Recurvomyces mirabilis TaxID=574656 RepID=UPI002DDEBC33|nr:hypothetical protein LTS14_002288 [Recurvomyces mirabilis]
MEVDLSYLQGQDLIATLIRPKQKAQTRAERALAVPRALGEKCTIQQKLEATSGSHYVRKKKERKEKGKKKTVPRKRKAAEEEEEEEEEEEDEDEDEDEMDVDEENCEMMEEEKENVPPVEQRSKRARTRVSYKEEE